MRVIPHIPNADATSDWSRFPWAAELEQRCAAAAASADCYADRPPQDRAVFLEAIADELEQVRSDLLDAAHIETGLPMPRLEGELFRTTGQLRFHASHLRERSNAARAIDDASAKAKLRLQWEPLGPVAVFGASNFPLAFSTAGGDTASALAAGCPVVVKQHPAHPRTGAIAAQAVTKAATRTGMPSGTFGSLSSDDFDLGEALVRDPRIKAVGFTGSRAGGLALVQHAQMRPVPIPVYAEMSSVNPVLLMPGALHERSELLADEFVASLTLGAGQLCTNPGILVALEGPDFDRFLARAGDLVAQSQAARMLTPDIHHRFQAAVAERSHLPGVNVVAFGRMREGPLQAPPSLFTTSAEVFFDTPELAEEVFGASSLAIACRNSHDLLAVLARLGGQLTVTAHMAADDQDRLKAWLPRLRRQAGRLVFNQWPTGVAVAEAMVHGGPYPSTSDGRSTSVGAHAVDRFLRPVCYQNEPAWLLADGDNGASA